jgi:hypothetical protein
MTVNRKIVFLTEWRAPGSGPAAARDAGGLPIFPAAALTEAALLADAEIGALKGPEWKSVSAELSAGAVVSDASLSGAAKTALSGRPEKAAVFFRIVPLQAAETGALLNGARPAEFETCAPAELFFSVSGAPEGGADDFEGRLDTVLNWIKSLGEGRDRGLGACVFGHAGDAGGAAE